MTVLPGILFYFVADFVNLVPLSSENHIVHPASRLALESYQSSPLMHEDEETEFNRRKEEEIVKGDLDKMNVINTCI